MLLFVIFDLTCFIPYLLSLSSGVTRLSFSTPCVVSLLKFALGLSISACLPAADTVLWLLLMGLDMMSLTGALGRY